MKIALDPFMHRHLSLEDLPSNVAELGYEWIELSPRADFLEWFKAPRAFPDRIKSFRKALSDANVGIATLLPMYRWASNDEDERKAAIPDDWRERFIEAYDQEFREWIVAAGNGTATGPSSWDGYAATLTADAALRAVASGGLEHIKMIEKPALYGASSALAAE